MSAGIQPLLGIACYRHILSTHRPDAQRIRLFVPASELIEDFDPHRNVSRIVRAGRPADCAGRTVDGQPGRTFAEPPGVLFGVPEPIDILRDPGFRVFPGLVVAERNKALWLIEIGLADGGSMPRPGVNERVRQLDIV